MIRTRDERQGSQKGAQRASSSAWLKALSVATVVALTELAAPDAKAQDIPIDVPSDYAPPPGVGRNSKDSVLRRNLRREKGATITDLLHLWGLYQHYRDMLTGLGSQYVFDMEGAGYYLLDSMGDDLIHAGLDTEIGQLVSFAEGAITSGADLEALFNEVYVPNAGDSIEEQARRTRVAAEQALALAKTTLLSANDHALLLESRNADILESLMGEVRGAFARTTALEELQADVDLYTSQEYFLLEHATLLLANLKATRASYEAFIEAQSAVRTYHDAPAAVTASENAPIPAAPTTFLYETP